MRRLRLFWEGLGAAAESPAVPCLLALVLVVIHVALLVLGLGGAIER